MKPFIHILFISLLFSPAYGKLIRVPGEQANILNALSAADRGDTILLSPGIYEENITLEKEVCIASHYILSGDDTYIENTIVDGQSITVFKIYGPADGASSIVGLTIRNGEDGIFATAPFHLSHCIVTECHDGIDYETGGGGTVCDNVFKKNDDDGIDLDGTLGTLRIERNIISDNYNDGIEIRLHNHQGEIANCFINDNLIFNNKEDGIQFIDYADTSDRFYRVEGNLIYNNSMAGIGLMDEGETDEDYRAAPIPEPIFLFNNTIINHEYGLTGGGNLVSLNNLFLDSNVAGIKGLTGSSILSHCLFHGNGIDLEAVDISSSHISNEDPLLNAEFYPRPASPCIDGGTAIFMSDSDTLLFLSPEEYKGSSPDLGACEYDESTIGISFKESGQIFIHPNPFNNYLQIQIPSDGQPLSEVEYEILDVMGYKMVEFTAKEEGIILETSHFPRGIYFLHQVNKKKWSICLIKI